MMTKVPPTFGFSGSGGPATTTQLTHPKPISAARFPIGVSRCPLRAGVGHK
jgi:hypothetical protein